MTHVVCVGDLMVDVVAQLPGPLAAGSDTPAPIAFHGGGAAANVAAWLAARGARRRPSSAGSATTPLGGVPSASSARGRCSTRAVELDPDARRPGPASSSSTRPASARWSRAPARTTRRDVGAAARTPTASTCPATRCSAPARGRSRWRRSSAPGAGGWSVAVDAASAAPAGRAGAGRSATWVGTDVLLFANDDEAAVLGADVRELGARFGAAVVKHGAGGASWSDGDRVEHVPAVPAAVLDTTGAGDAFAAGFLAASLSGADPRACLAAGAELGARAVTLPGARP